MNRPVIAYRCAIFRPNRPLYPLQRITLILEEGPSFAPLAWTVGAVIQSLIGESRRR
jgi:hypothetical protein